MPVKDKQELNALIKKQPILGTIFITQICEGLFSLPNANSQLFNLGDSFDNIIDKLNSDTTMSVAIKINPLQLDFTVIVALFVLKNGYPQKLQVSLSEEFIGVLTQPSSTVMNTIETLIAQAPYEDGWLNPSPAKLAKLFLDQCSKAIQNLTRTQGPTSVPVTGSEAPHDITNETAPTPVSSELTLHSAPKSYVPVPPPAPATPSKLSVHKKNIMPLDKSSDTVSRSSYSSKSMTPGDMKAVLEAQKKLAEKRAAKAELAKPDSTAQAQRGSATAAPSVQLRSSAVSLKTTDGEAADKASQPTRELSISEIRQKTQAEANATKSAQPVTPNKKASTLRPYQLKALESAKKAPAPSRSIPQTPDKPKAEVSYDSINPSIARKEMAARLFNSPAPSEKMSMTPQQPSRERASVLVQSLASMLTGNKDNGLAGQERIIAQRMEKFNAINLIGYLYTSYFVADEGYDLCQSLGASKQKLRENIMDRHKEAEVKQSSTVDYEAELKTASLRQSKLLVSSEEADTINAFIKDEITPILVKIYDKLIGVTIKPEQEEYSTTEVIRIIGHIINTAPEQIAFSSEVIAKLDSSEQTAFSKLAPEQQNLINGHILNTISNKQVPTLTTDIKGAFDVFGKLIMAERLNNLRQLITNIAPDVAEQAQILQQQPKHEEKESATAPGV